METIRRFVRDGGGLVATYETSRYDEHAKPRETLGLADVFQAGQVGVMDTRAIRMDFSGKPIDSATLCLPPAHRWSSDPQLAETFGRPTATQPPSTMNRNIPLHCRMLLVDPTGTVKPPVRLRTTTVEKSSGKIDRADHAAIIETSYGKGKVIYIPFDASWMYFRYGHAQLGRMMELALRDTASEPPPVEVAAPSIVQTAVHVQGNRTVVHLLNDVSSMGRSQNVAGQSLYERREVIPIHDITLTFRGPAPKLAFLLPGNKPLTPVVMKEGWQVALPPLGVHAMFVAEP